MKRFVRITDAFLIALGLISLAIGASIACCFENVGKVWIEAWQEFQRHWCSRNNVKMKDQNEIR